MRQVVVELEALRRRSRVMLVAQRLAIIVAWTLGVAAALILFDFALRLPSFLRLALMVGGLGAAVYSTIVYLRPAAGFKPSLTSLALRVEQVLPRVAGRLASSVEFAASGLDQESPLAARSVRDTESRLAGESVFGIISPGRTWRALGVMAVVVLAVGAAVSASPTGARTGLNRLLLPYSDTQWPARTGVESLMDEILGESAVHPRSQSLLLRAQVTKGPDDQRVNARFRLQTDGRFSRWSEIVLTHQRDGVHERLIDTNGERLELQFTTEDARSELLTIELVPPPAYASGRYPAQDVELGPGLDERSVTEVPSLVGSLVQLRFELNKPLPGPGRGEDRSAWLAQTFGWTNGDPPGLRTSGAMSDVWTLEWTQTGTRDLNLSLVDEHGLGNTDAISYRIEAVEDRQATVTVMQPPADEAVLASAVVRVVAEARDDVSVAAMGMTAALQAALDAGEAPTDSVWEHSRSVDAPTATLEAELDLAILDVVEGDVVLVVATAQDTYELDGLRHPEASSPARRLRIISELDLASQLRRELGAVRQNAIRIEAIQAELQDDVIDDGMQPGISRAQAQIGERVATQRESIEQLRERLDRNRLEDEQLDDLLQQAGDLLDYAGRAVNRAVEEVERAESRRGESRRSDEAQDGARGERRSGSESDPGRPSEGQPPPVEQDAEPDAEVDEQPAEGDLEEFEIREPAEEDVPVVEAQQEVRDELADLIELLDRDEDTWVVTRQLESLLDEQAQIQAAAGQLGNQTIGRERDELSTEELSELDRIAQAQRDLAEQSRQLIDELRERGDDLEEIDPQSAAGLRMAADTGEQNELDRDMSEAAERVEQNQLRSAQGAQQTARQTMERMLEDIRETKRARAQELLRRLASLIESIQRLITVQENEITALAGAEERASFSGRDRAMIRLNQNTQAVAGEARASGQETRRVARALDRAADAQGAAVAALRAAPIAVDAAAEAEERSLEMLREAKELAESLQEDVEQQETQRQRDELLAAYRKLAEMQIALRNETLELAGPDELDRRRLVEARRLGNVQDELRVEADDIRRTTQEIDQSPIFTHVHRMINDWSRSVTKSLQEGTADVDVTDAQMMIADSLGRLIQALEESFAPPEEFANQSNSSGGGNNSGGAPPLVPPVAQLRLLRGLQEQVYDQTRALDTRNDLDAGRQRTRMRDLGRQQRDLVQFGEEMLESLQGQGGATPGQGGDAPDTGGPR